MGLARPGKAFGAPMADHEVRMANSPDEMQTWLGTLADAGADIFHCSRRRFWEPEFTNDGSDIDVAGWRKR